MNIQLLYQTIKNVLSRQNSSLKYNTPEPSKQTSKAGRQAGRQKSKNYKKRNMETGRQVEVEPRVRRKRN